MPEEPVYEVVAPVHDSSDQRSLITPKPQNLSNRKVAFVWDYLFNGPTFFSAIRDQIEASYSNVEFVDYENFGNISTIPPAQLEKQLPSNLRAAGVDVAVVAVGA
jgi:hypothetical protein